MARGGKLFPPVMAPDETGAALRLQAFFELGGLCEDFSKTNCKDLTNLRAIPPPLKLE